MSTTEIVQTFYRLNNEVPAGKARLEELQALLAPDFTFTGPLMQVKGAGQFIGLLRQFMPFHKSVTVVKQFPGQGEVCSITRLQLKTPAGGQLSVDVAEVIQVEAGRIKSLTIYYDPRGFAAAFPMP